MKAPITEGDVVKVIPARLEHMGYLTRKYKVVKIHEVGPDQIEIVTLEEVVDGDRSAALKSKTE